MTFEEYQEAYPRRTLPRERNLRYVPAWTPTCPACGERAEWIAALDLLVRCTACPRWEQGVYPGGADFKHLEERWKR